MKQELLSKEEKQEIRKKAYLLSFSCKMILGNVLFLFLFPFYGLYAQNTLNASGGSASIAGDLYAYSIGEMLLVSTETSPTIVVTQGVLQASSINMGMEENTSLGENIRLYPNPVANTLYLQPSLSGGGGLSLHLFDMMGRLVMKSKINLQTGVERQEIDLSSLQEGTYLLQVHMQQGKRIYEHAFKILKLGTY